MRKTLLHLVAVSLCGSVGAGELLPNGIRLPDVWPPMCVSATISTGWPVTFIARLNVRSIASKSCPSHEKTFQP